ncbi:methyl-accepting chemotaxis protein [Rhodopseudomonas sp. B29]|uniref:methyl-accepting chemotaxis protein n=1 Tax=Rhodopseudomonas sp. B29 TaxID=95607 RepID=UPI000348507A|nr:HAMP domain-containing methyl-accepting chemotaxis protein [Rhodopseudomonas sp. B29]
MSHAALTAASRAPDLFSFFTNRKIGIKVAIGFAVVQVLMAVLAVLNYSCFGRLENAFATFAQRVQVVDIASDVDRGFSKMRLAVRDYNLTGDEARIGEAETQQKALSESIARGLTAIKNPERLAQMEALRSEFDRYVSDFADMVKMRRDQNRLLGEVLDPIGQTARLRLEALQNALMNGDGNPSHALLVSDALKKLLILRLAASKAVGRTDTAGAAAAEDAKASAAALGATVAALKTAIDSADERKQVAAVETDLGKYLDGYQRALQQGRTLQTQIIGMGKLAQSIGLAAANIRDSGLADERNIGAETSGTISDSKSQILWLTLGAMAIGLVLAWLVGRAISRPIVAMSGVMKELAGGNLKVEVVGSGRLDEIGLMACTVEVFKKNALEVAELKAEQEEAERRVAAQHKAEMQRLADDFENAVGEIIDTVTSAATELEASAGTLTATAEHSQQLATSVAAASEQASSNVQSVASATEEMASSINEISRQVQESARIAGDAVDQARKTNDRISQLASAANRIGDVVELINTIAGQTNLLALNATIEAARAGDAGRGFAVVAQEVKALAEQTAKATGEISSQISGMQSATQDSVGAIREIGGTIERMSEIASTIASAVEQQGAATQEISRNVQQAAHGTQDVSAHVVDVQRGATETGTASTQVHSAAQSLSRDSNRLKDEVTRFVETVRAA